MIAEQQFDLFAEHPDLREHAGRMLAFAQRDRALEHVERNAGEEFMERAKEFVVSYLGQHQEAAGEAITDACKAAGIAPHCDKAFGAVYASLSRRGVIAKAGYCARRKGNLTAGGIRWRLNN